MRAFSTIEILIALAILTTTVIAVAQVALGAPFMLANMQLESAAAYGEDAELSRIEHLSSANTFDRIHSLASSTTNDVDDDGVGRDEVMEHSLDVQLTNDGESAHAAANSSWTDAYGMRRESMLETTMSDVSSENPCDSFVSGTWSSPRIRTYALTPGDLLPTSMPGDTYPVADLHASRNTLIAAVGATAQTTSPTLFFFDISNSAAKPVMIGTGFDNASTSRIGFTAITTGGDYAYTANGFGSASPIICAGGASCAQVQIYSLPGTHPPHFISSVSLATSTAPFAVSASGTTAPATSITYSHSLIYLGLQKTVSGDEFNIIDVSDPQHPQWLSGMPIGRSVNHILVRDGFAYVATDDNSHELMIFDVHDSRHPVLAGIWNAPGSTGFGFGTALSMYGSTLLLGRSYASNASEITTLDIHDMQNIKDTGSKDVGTLLDPESVRDFLSQDFLTFALLTKKLQFWNFSEASSLSEYAPSLSFPAGTTGTRLACRENTLYVGLEQTAPSTGSIEVISSS